jgi:hypothetical protein
VVPDSSLPLWQYMLEEVVRGLAHAICVFCLPLLGLLRHRTSPPLRSHCAS